jgi:AraC family transcriptional regulator
MQPRIETLIPKRLIGKKLIMTFADNKTVELWKSFMPGRKEITNNLTNDLISMQVYDSKFDFNNFILNAEFEKWAAVEVRNFDTVPSEMETYTLTGGLYAVFHYKGSNRDTRIFRYIFGTWLPNSGYSVDNRPHFEILGEKYRNDDPDSEEEIWIPVKPK